MTGGGRGAHFTLSPYYFRELYLLIFLLLHFVSVSAQLRSVQEEMDSLEEEKESELAETQEELRAAQEEVLLLQQAAEEAAAERENDIASLQEELCRRRAELQRLSEETQEYELEITTLRAEISMKSQRREAERREGEGRRGLNINFIRSRLILSGVMVDSWIQPQLSMGQGGVTLDSSPSLGHI